MKLKDGFLLREIAGRIVVVPTGNTFDLNLMITLNNTARFLWERLEKGAEAGELVDALLEEYDVDRETAAKAVADFCEKLKDHELLA